MFREEDGTQIRISRRGLDNVNLQHIVGEKRHDGQAVDSRSNQHREGIRLVVEVPFSSLWKPKGGKSSVCGGSRGDDNAEKVTN
jgi:hypothetical protein